MCFNRCPRGRWWRHAMKLSVACSLKYEFVWCVVTTLSAPNRTNVTAWAWAGLRRRTSVLPFIISFAVADKNGHVYCRFYVFAGRSSQASWLGDLLKEWTVIKWYCIVNRCEIPRLSEIAVYFCRSSVSPYHRESLITADFFVFMCHGVGVFKSVVWKCCHGVNAIFLALFRFYISVLSSHLLREFS